jgi:hypothetical protein
MIAEEAWMREMYGVPYAGGENNRRVSNNVPSGPAFSYHLC